MFVINEDKFCILFTNYGVPLEQCPLEKLHSLQDIVHTSLLHGKPVHLIEDDDITFGKLFYIRATVPASGLCDLGQSDDQKEQPANPYAPVNGTANAGEKFKIEISGGDGAMGD